MFTFCYIKYCRPLLLAKASNYKNEFIIHYKYLDFGQNLNQSKTSAKP